MTYFISTVTKAAKCSRCRAAVLAALDEGIPTRVDVIPLADRAAEITALLDGRCTYTRNEYGYLFHRDASRIAGNTVRGTIHAEHRCKKGKR